MAAIQQIMLALGGAKPLPEFVSAGTPNRVSTTVNTLPAPSIRPDGSKLIAIMAHVSSGSSLVSIPSGFNLVASDNSGQNSYYVYEKTAASESGDYAFTWANSGGNTGVVLCYQLGNTFTAGAVTKANSATTTAPSISPTVSGVLLQIFYVEAATTVSTAPSGTQRSVYTGNSPSLAVYEIAPSAAGATGDKTLVWSNSGQNGGNLIQLTNE